MSSILLLLHNHILPNARPALPKRINHLLPTFAHHMVSLPYVVFSSPIYYCSFNVPQPPTSPRRTGGKVSTVADPSRALSPVRSQKSQVTGRTRGTEYPPLPTSAFEGSHAGDVPNSPISKPNSYAIRHDKAPSVSPSDSQSQAYYKRTPSKSPPPRDVLPSGSPELSPRSGPRQIANGNGCEPLPHFRCVVT
jgi:hypothetical protein